MPTYEIRVDGQRRSFLLSMPPDWASYPWGSLPLLLGLHGGGETPEQFYENAEIERLIAGALTPDAVGDPVPQKLIAVFPQGLSVFDTIAGEWNMGWGSGPTGIVDVDDVQAILACVEKADEVLGEAYALLNAVPVPTTPFFADAGILVMGFSHGCAMAYRCGAELPDRDTKWGLGVLTPTCIAVAEHSAGGYKHADITAWPGPPLTPGGLTIPLVRWAPVVGVQISLLHMHSDRDLLASYRGGTAPDNVDKVDLNLGAAPGTSQFYRWDIRPGADAPTPFPSSFDPTAAPIDQQEAIGPWVSALPGGPWSAAVSSITLDTGLLAERHQWDWRGSLVVFGGPSRAVRFILWRSDGASNQGHYWPRTDDVTGFLWSGTAEAWQFFLDHS